MTACRILIVDDEPQLRRVMRAALLSNHFEPYEARTGEEALDVLREFQPDLVLLDLNMPGLGGMETCRTLRHVSEAPIIVLSVRNSESDKVSALDAGADDYLTKPFSVNELLARIRAHLRRGPLQAEPQPPLTLAPNVLIDFTNRKLSIRGKLIRLTPKEFDLLQLMAAHLNQPVPHRKLLQTVWGAEYGEEVEYLRVFVSQLRKKMEADPAHPRFLVTEPWVGYCLKSDV